MKNDLKEMPFAPGKFFMVENYWEAAGVMSALRAGIERIGPKTQHAGLADRGVS